MSKSAIVTTRLDADTVDIVDRIAMARGQSRSSFVATVVRQAAIREADFLTFIQEGIDDLDAGRSVPQDIVIAELDAMIARHEARCRE